MSHVAFWLLFVVEGPMWTPEEREAIEEDFAAYRRDPKGSLGKAAIARVFTAMQPGFVRQFRGFTRDDVADLLQNVHLEIMVKADQLERPRAAVAWMLRVAVSVAASARKGRGWCQLSEDAELEAMLAGRKMVSTERRIDMLRALDAVQEEHLVVLNLEEVPEQEAAQVLRISVRTFRRKRRKARAEMRRLSQDGPRSTTPLVVPQPASREI